MEVPALIGCCEHCPISIMKRWSAAESCFVYMSSEVADGSDWFGCVLVPYIRINPKRTAVTGPLLIFFSGHCKSLTGTSMLLALGATSRWRYAL